ncbi:hypothetical protein [Moraxella nonliquefaciens]|nr:hypothetical protein [Moraxella nonliquefaciens]
MNKIARGKFEHSDDLSPSFDGFGVNGKSGIVESLASDEASP